MAFIVAFITALLLSQFGHAREKLGTIEVSDLYLEPSFNYSPSTTQKNGFDLGRYYGALNYKYDESIGAHFRFGSTSLLVTPFYLTEEKKFGLIEGYVEARSALGRLRFGKVPVMFGYEGSLEESQTLWDYSLFYQHRYLPRRDMGASYFIRYNSIQTVFTIHNGEADEDRDQRLWFTGRWSWHGPANSEIGFSGSAGRYLDATLQSEERMRLGNFFGGFDIYGLGVAFDVTLITYLQGSEYKDQSLHYHLDAQTPVVGEFGALARYDVLDPRTGMENDLKRELSLGISYSSKYKNSVFMLVGTKRWEEASEAANDGIKVIWKLTPWSSYTGASNTID